MILILNLYYIIYSMKSQVTTPIMSSVADYVMSSQGPLPSPITDLDLTAEKYGKECVTYVMMNPDVEMMCRDAIGKIIATTAEELLLSGNMVSFSPFLSLSLSTLHVWAFSVLNFHILSTAIHWASGSPSIVHGLTSSIHALLRLYRINISALFLPLSQP